MQRNLYHLRRVRLNDFVKAYGFLLPYADSYYPVMGVVAMEINGVFIFRVLNNHMVISSKMDRLAHATETELVSPTLLDHGVMLVKTGKALRYQILSCHQDMED